MFSPLDILENWDWDKVPSDIKPYIADMVAIIRGDDEAAKEKLWFTICAYAGIHDAVEDQLRECESCPKQPLHEDGECEHSC
jgi:hypothetical protein